MKTVCIVAVSSCLCALLATTASAAKADGPKARFFAKYDKNKNGVIDGEEKDVLRKDFAADKESNLQRFDKDKNGKLSDEEIAAIKPPVGKGKGSRSGKAKAGKSGKAKKAQKTEKKDKSGKQQEKHDGKAEESGP